MLRGNVYAALDNERACLDDLKKAAGLNPVDPLVAKALATALCARNNRLGDKVSSEQQIEAKQAIERALHLDPRDVSLLTIYAGMVGKDEPMKALALHQAIQMNAPTVQNGVLLGKLATQMALHESDETKGQGFFAIAESAFVKVRVTLAPSGTVMMMLPWVPPLKFQWLRTGVRPAVMVIRTLFVALS